MIDPSPSRTRFPPDTTRTAAPTPAPARVPRPVSPVTVTLAASLIVIASGCGSATGELPVGRDAGRPGDPSSGAAGAVFGDPSGWPGAPSVASTDTAAADVLERAPLPASGPGPVLADPAEAEPFDTPDPAAVTLLARLAYRPLAELADTLVAARHVDDYLAVDGAVLALVEPSDALSGAARETLDCPDGGRVDVARESGVRGATLELAFDGCALDDVTLSGALTRATPVEEPGARVAETLELDYRELVVDGTVRTTTLNGTTRRRTVRSANVDCDGDDVELAVLHRLDLAHVARPGEAATRIVDGRHELEVHRLRLTPTGEPSDCHERSTSVFEGGAIVSEGPFGSARAMLSRRGSLVRDTHGNREPPSNATLDVTIDDGSRLSLGLLSDRDASAQVDVLADGIAASFTTAFRFEP